MIGFDFADILPLIENPMEAQALVFAKIELCRLESLIDAYLEAEKSEKVYNFK